MKNDENRDFNFVRSVWLVTMAFFALKEIISLVKDPYMADGFDMFFGGLGAVMGCIMLSLAWTEHRNELKLQKTVKMEIQHE